MSAAPELWRVYVACGLCALIAFCVSVLAAPGMLGVLGGALAIVMVAIAAIDLRRFIIPNPLVLAGLALGLLHVMIIQSEMAPAAIMRGIVLALAFWGLRAAYLRLRGQEGIGLGDVKLAAVAGVWLDWMAMSFAIEIAALTALAVLGIRAFRGQRITGKTRVPFGFFFAPAIWAGWLLEAVLSWKL